MEKACRQRHFGGLETVRWAFTIPSFPLKTNRVLNIFREAELPSKQLRDLAVTTHDFFYKWATLDQEGKELDNTSGEA